MLWGLINSLQLVTHFPLANAPYPDNAAIYFGALLELASFDLIPTDWAEDEIDDKVGDANKSESDFVASEHLSQSTIDAGYDNQNILTSNIVNYALAAALGFATILVLIFRAFCYKVDWVKNCLQKIWRFFFWNFVIRFVVETAIELLISNFVRLLAFRSDSWYETFLSSVSICSIAILGIYAVLVTPFL